MDLAIPSYPLAIDRSLSYSEVRVEGPGYEGEEDGRRRFSSTIQQLYQLFNCCVETSCWSNISLCYKKELGEELEHAG